MVAPFESLGQPELGPNPYPRARNRAGGRSRGLRTTQDNDRKQRAPRMGTLRGAKRAHMVGIGRALVHRCAIWIVWRAESRSECVQSWAIARLGGVDHRPRLEPTGVD